MSQTDLSFICDELRLGSPHGEMVRVYGSRGGSLLWRVNTEKGSYAIKQLAPAIDLKSEMMVAKYELSETIADRFKQKGIPAVSALEKSGKHLFILEKTGYLVYPWVEGYTLDRNEVLETHSLKIAELIAKIHSTNLSMPEVEAPRFDIYTNESIVEAIDKAVSFKCSFAKMLKEQISLILAANESYLAAIPALKENALVTHGDLDPLNILWDKAGQPILIDWESARKMNKTRDLIRTSLSWSVSAGQFSSPIYTHMLGTYIKSGGIININHVDAALHGIFGSQIFWMLYNIEFACASDVPEERATAIQEINSVLTAMKELNMRIPDLLKITVEACLDLL